MPLISVYSSLWVQTSPIARFTRISTITAPLRQTFHRALPTRYHILPQAHAHTCAVPNAAPSPKNIPRAVYIQGRAEATRHRHRGPKSGSGMRCQRLFHRCDPPSSFPCDKPIFLTALPCCIHPQTIQTVSFLCRHTYQPLPGFLQVEIPNSLLRAAKWFLTTVAHTPPCHTEHQTSSIIFILLVCGSFLRRSLSGDSAQRGPKHIPWFGARPGTGPLYIGKARLLHSLALPLTAPDFSGLGRKEFWRSLQLSFYSTQGFQHRMKPTNIAITLHFQHRRKPANIAIILQHSMFPT